MHPPQDQDLAPPFCFNQVFVLTYFQTFAAHQPQLLLDGEEEVRLDERLTEDILWQRAGEQEKDKIGGGMTNMEQEEGRGEEGS